MDRVLILAQITLGVLGVLGIASRIEIPKDAYSDTYKVTINATRNDTDADGGINRRTLDLNPQTSRQDTVLINVDGVWKADVEEDSSNLGSVTFEPNPSLKANPSPITYTVRDNDGNISNPATLTVTYKAFTSSPFSNNINTTNVSFSPPSGIVYGERPVAKNDRNPTPKGDLLFWFKHLLRVSSALLITFLVSRLSAKTIVRLSPLVYLSLLFALFLVILPIPISVEIKGARRWLDLGFFSFQPSEFMKIAVVAYLAGFFYNHIDNWEIWRPMLVVGLAMGLIVLEPNYSTTGFIFCLAMGIMIAAGITLMRFLSISLAAALLATLMLTIFVGSDSHFWKRIKGYVDIWGEQEQTDEISYQAKQVQEALIQAGFFGVGIGASERPQVPEAHSDMIAIAIGNTLGLLGIATLIALYTLIVMRSLKITAAVKGPSSLLAAGAVIYIGGQASLNLLVASGLFPVTGVTLPFVSHGLSSLISVSAAMGLIHMAYREAKLQGAAV